MRGEAQGATSTFLTFPTKTNTEASWEFELALCRLEAGTPGLAAEPFTEALKLTPNLSTRPVVAYYLEKLGKPVPPALASDDNSPPKDQPTRETR